MNHAANQISGRQFDSYSGAIKQSPSLYLSGTGLAINSSPPTGGTGVDSRDWCRRSAISDDSLLPLDHIDGDSVKIALRIAITVLNRQGVTLVISIGYFPSFMQNLPA